MSSKQSDLLIRFALRWTMALWLHLVTQELPREDPIHRVMAGIACEVLAPDDICSLRFGIGAPLIGHTWIEVLDRISKMTIWTSVLVKPPRHDSISLDYLRIRQSLTKGERNEFRVLPFVSGLRNASL